MPPKNATMSWNTPPELSEKTDCKETSVCTNDCMLPFWLLIKLAAVALSMLGNEMEALSVSRYCGVSERKFAASAIIGGKKKYRSAKRDPKTSI